MGKVQDTSSRLKQRHRHHSSPAIALIIPSQQKPSSHSFPITYQAVSNWISAQSAKGFDTGLKGQIKGLQHSNRLTNSPIERLKIMDLFAEEIQRTIPHLTSRYTGTNLPYSLSAQIGFKQAVTLFTELSFGYKAALVDVLLGREKLTQKSRVHAIYHAMQAIAECGLQHSQAYTPWPDKSWRDINTLLLLAEHEKVLDVPVKAASGSKKAPTTIRKLYGALALFSVSQAEQLSPHQMDTLFATLCKDPHPFELFSEKPRNSTATTYSVALNSATPPSLDRFCQYAEHHQVRYFTIQPYHIQIARGTTTENKSPINLDRHVRQKIDDTWSQSTFRQHARSIRHIDFYTQHHLKNITASLNAMTQGNTTDRPLSSKWTLTNESANGVGLLSTGNGNCYARVSDLVAWRTDREISRNITYTVGVVRWLKSEGVDVLKIGIETIGQFVCSASVSTVDKKSPQNNSTVDALLCKSPKPKSESTLVLLPPDTFKAGECVNLAIAASKHQSLMMLTEKLEEDGKFDCFVISEASNPHNSRGKG